MTQRLLYESQRDGELQRNGLHTRGQTANRWWRLNTCPLARSPVWLCWSAADKWPGELPSPLSSWAMPRCRCTLQHGTHWLFFPLSLSLLLRTRDWVFIQIARGWQCLGRDWQGVSHFLVFSFFFFSWLRQCKYITMTTLRTGFLKVAW